MKSKLKLCIVLILLSFSACLFGQRFIYCSLETVVVPPGVSYHNTTFGVFDVEECQDSIIGSRFGYDIRDIVLLSDNNFLGFTYWDRDSATGVGKFKYINGSLELIGISPSPDGEDGKIVTALGCNGNRVAYAAGTGLSSFFDRNPTEPLVLYIGDFPPDMQAAGDLTFREGKLYMSTLANTLVEVDVVNPMNSQVFMTFPAGTPPIHAMTTIHGACGETITYAVGTHATGSIIYELDFATKTLTEKCRTTFRIMGAASAEECINTVCKVYIDLDKDNSSGGRRNDFRPASVCNAAVYIADRDLEVYAEEAIDSVVITLNGILDTGSENLTAAATTANLSITGSGTSKIKLVNMGTATVQDFQTAISNIFYKNNSATPTNGNREVWVRGYTRSFVSELATAKIQIQNSLTLEQDSIALKCHGDAGIDFTAMAKGGVAPYHYQWINGDTSAMRSNLAVGSYFLTISDQSGCQSVDTVHVTPPDFPKPVLQLTPNGSLCEGGTLKIDASLGFASYQWSNGVQTPSITIDEPGSYRVTVTSAAGCSDTASIAIVQKNIEAFFLKTDPSCFGKKDGRIVVDTIIGGNPPFSYQLNNGTVQAVHQFNALAPDTYQLKIEDQNGCTILQEINLIEPEPLTLSIGDDTSLSLGDSLVLTAQTNALDPLIQWHPTEGLSCDTCLTTIAKPVQSIQYEVTLTDQAGCVAKDAISIEVNQQAGVFLPNAFSPNGDGVNDVFTVFTDGSVQAIHYLRVFDRWGNLLYAIENGVPNDVEKGWDGSFKGEQLPTGTYLYVLQLERIDGVLEQMKGEVLLVR